MCQHPQNGLNDFLDLFVGEPFLFAEHFLADESVLDVGVVDGGAKLDEWELEGELFWEVEVDDELVAFVGAGEWSLYEKFPVE